MKTIYQTIADVAAEADHNGQPHALALEALRTSGLLGLNIPQCHGGQGCGPSECNRRIAELAGYDASLAIIVFQHLSVACRIMEFGTDEQNRHFLPRMASGEMLAASAWSEKGAGADKRQLGTFAVPQADGTWLVNGTKTFTTGVGLAGVYLVLVKTSETELTDSRYGASGQTFFLIESDTAGVLTRTDLNITGMRSSSTGFLELVDCRVPASNILAPVGDAVRVIANVRQCGLTLGAVSVGIADAAVEIARQSVRKLRTDSRQYHTAALRLARIAVQACAARALVEQAGRRESSKVGIDTLAAKIFASEVSEQVCRETQQLLGGGGFIRGTNIDRLVRDARAVALMGPVNDLALDLVSEELLA